MLRSRLDIFAQVLETALKGATKTKIVSQTNLNQKFATHSLNLLVNLDLLIETHNSPISYSTTEKGLQFLQEYRCLQKLLNSKTN